MLSPSDRIVLEEQVRCGIEYFKEFFGAQWYEDVDATLINMKSVDNNVLSLVTGEPWVKAVIHFDNQYPKTPYSAFGFDTAIGNSQGDKKFDKQYEKEAYVYLTALWVIAVNGSYDLWEDQY